MALNLNNYKRISGLTEKTELEEGDVFAVDNATDAASQKITYGSLRALLKTFFKLGSLGAGTYIRGNSYASDLVLLDSAISDQSGLFEDVLADLAPVEATTSASRAYPVGSYLVYNKQLYTVTSAIASSGTIVPGTNVSAITVGTALITAVLALADAYDTTISYSVGDLVTYSGNLYICTTATLGAWNSASWLNVTVGDLIEGIVSDIDTINTTLNGKQDTLTFDDTPTQNSGNPVKSGGVYTAVQANTTAIANEKTRAQQAEGANATAIANEKTRAQQAEGANAAALQAYKDLLGLTVDDEGYICQTI